MTVMANTFVSKEALQKVRTSFSNFQTEVETTTAHMQSHAEAVVSETRDSIKKQQQVVASLDKKVSSLNNEIERLQTQIISNNNSMSSLNSGIADRSSQAEALRSQSSQLESQRRSLMSGGPASENGEQNNGGQIQAIENQIRSCRAQVSKLNEQIASMQSQSKSLGSQTSQLKGSKVKAETELTAAKNDCNKSRDKHERMKSAGTIVESEIGNLISVVQKFQQTAILSSSANSSGVDKCITAVDDYMSVNLGVGGSGSKVPGSGVGPV